MFYFFSTLLVRSFLSRIRKKLGEYSMISTREISLVAEYDFPKVGARVRFPYFAQKNAKPPYESGVMH